MASEQSTHYDEGFSFPKYAEFHQRYNPGHDFRRFVRMLDEAPADKFNQVFAAGARNPLGAILACCAIEGYLHFVGHHVDPAWDGFINNKNTVKDRIERIYSLLNKPVDFGCGVMQRVIQLFNLRNELVHPRFEETREEGSSPPLTVLDRVDTDFPTAKSRQIAEDFRKQILHDSKVEDMWMRTGFVEKEKAARSKREV